MVVSRIWIVGANDARCVTAGTNDDGITRLNMRMKPSDVFWNDWCAGLERIATPLMGNIYKPRSRNQRWHLEDREPVCRLALLNVGLEFAVIEGPSAVAGMAERVDVGVRHPMCCDGDYICCRINGFGFGAEFVFSRLNHFQAERSFVETGLVSTEWRSERKDFVRLHRRDRPPNRVRSEQIQRAAIVRPSAPVVCVVRPVW
jgi:hypothetical protein